jgi:hypothetical protein
MKKITLSPEQITTWIMLLCIVMFVALYGKIIFATLCLLGAIVCGFLLGIGRGVWFSTHVVALLYKRPRFRDNNCSCEH